MPGSDERELEQALASAADGVVADLEDSVAPAAKAEARDVVARVLRGHVASGHGRGTVPQTCLRLNGVESTWFADDLALAHELDLVASEQELVWAREVIAAFEGQDEGVLALDGTMIDRPVVERARRLVAESERSD